MSNCFYKMPVEHWSAEQTKHNLDHKFSSRTCPLQSFFHQVSHSSQQTQKKEEEKTFQIMKSISENMQRGI